VIRPVDAICLTAPTASGKTELSLRLAETIPLEIISMDSAMVYRGMDIGTAKPSLHERQAAPHHLIDILDPAEAYSAGKFVDDTRRLVSEIRARGRLPLIVGGTMLYLKALKRGLASLPRADAAVREALDAEAARLGWPALHEQLAEVDPAAAARIAPNDRQRIQRALEVHRITGRALTNLQAETDAGSVNLLAIALLPADRAGLADRVAARLDAMLRAGFLDEVEALYKRGDLDLDTPSMRSVGYRQLWRHIAGEYGLAEAREKALIATRQLAKRQLTWLRSGLGDLSFSVTDESVDSRILETVSTAIDRWT